MRLRGSRGTSEDVVGRQEPLKRFVMILKIIIKYFMNVHTSIFLMLYMECQIIVILISIEMNYLLRTV